MTVLPLELKYRDPVDGEPGEPRKFWLARLDMEEEDGERMLVIRLPAEGVIALDRDQWSRVKEHIDKMFDKGTDGDLPPHAGRFRSGA